MPDGPNARFQTGAAEATPPAAPAGRSYLGAPPLSTPARPGTPPVGSGVASTRGASRRGGIPFRVRWRRDWQLVLMCLPAIALLMVFHYTPTLGSVIAFQDYSPYDGIRNSPWVGLSNFYWLLTDPAFWHAFRNTLVIMSFQLIFYFPIPIMLALLFDSVVRPRFRLFLQSVCYMPHFFSWVLVVSLFQQMVGGAGLLSQQLRQRGYDGIDIMTNPDTFIFLVTSQSIWKDAGWGAIIFLAALSAIDRNLYEAAAADGAGRWRRMWHVTLPGLRPVIILLLILRLGDALTVGFEQFILQRNAVGAGAAEILDTFVYYQTLLTGDWSYGAAAGLFKGVIGLILILTANKVAHMMGEHGIYRRA